MAILVMRAAVLLLMGALLAPLEAAAQVKLSKQAQEAAEARTAYDRAMVFFEQGAYKEAEKEFRTAEKKTDDKNIEYVMAAAFNYLKLHRPNDARKRYERIYKKDPTDSRALVGMAASYEEAQNYREAVKLWMRYAKMVLPPAEGQEAALLLRSAQELFAAHYEIAENPAGGAPNLATPQQELEWGLGAAKEIAASGLPLVADKSVSDYVANLSQALVKHAKYFPTNYELFVLDSATVNAVTTPGFIFVFRGILEAAEDEAALAGVLAHEIGHSVAHHAAKMQTRAAQDQQQLQKYRESNSGWSRFMASLLEGGNPLGQLRFSREQEEQADRLGVHIAFDAGWNPSGITQLFQKFESMSPSSRSSWDLMMQTHPFSIDRIHAVTEYAALLPPRATRTNSPEFTRMKARLKALPPPPDATGLMRPALPTKPPANPASGAGRLRAWSLTNAPFEGTMPEDWTARTTEAGTTVIEGAEGTDAYQVTVELQVAPRSGLKGLTLADMAGRVAANIKQRPQARVEAPVADRTPGGQPVMRMAATYGVEGERGRIVPVRHVSAVVEFPGWFAVVSYFGPESHYNRFLAEAEAIANSLSFTGR